MNSINNKNLLISFSGLCGAGKSTMVEMLKKHLVNNGVTCESFTLMHCTVPQSRILLKTSKYLKKRNLTDCDKEEYIDIMEAMGMVLAFEQAVVPSMESKRVLIFDRYIDNYVLNGIASQNAKELLNSIPKCDIRFYIDCDMKTASDRVVARGRSMQSDIDLAQQQSKRYHESILEKHPDFYTVVDSMGTVDDTFRRICGCVDEHLTEEMLLH